MKYNNRDVDKRRQAITVKQNATNSKVYSKQALEKLASGGYKNRVPELKKTVSQNNTPAKTVSQNNVPSVDQVKPSTRYQNQNIAKNVEQPKQTKRDTTYDRDFDTFHTYRYEKADMMDYDEKTGDSNPHWQTLKKEIMGKNKWTEAQFDEKWEAYNKERNQKDADREVKNISDLGKTNPILGTLASFAYTPQSMIEGGASMLSALLPGRKAETADDPMFTGTRAKLGARQNVKDENIKTGIGKGAYDVATSLGDMVLASGVPVLGAASLGGETAARTNMQALERGVDPTKAALTGLGAGAISGVLNKVGLDKAVNTTAKTALGSVLKAAGIEGAENVTEDTANLLIDTLMNKDKSQLNAMHDYYKSQGMTDDEAWNRVTLGTLGEMGISALSGAAFGGAMNGAGKIPELVGDIKALIPEMNNRGAVDPKALAD